MAGRHKFSVVPPILEVKDSIIQKPRKKIVNRALLSQRQYINLLSTPKPYPPPPKDPPPKKPPLKPPEMCSARLDQLSMPTKKNLEGVLGLYHNKFEPERVICMAKRIHIVTTMRQARTVPKKKGKPKKKKKKKDGKEIENRLAKEWLRDQINTSSFLVMLYMKYKPAYTPNYKQLLIALRIMKLLRLKKGRNYPKYTKRFVLQICEQVAVLIDSTCPPGKQRMLDVSAKEKEAEEKKNICWKIHSDLSLFGVVVEEEPEEEAKEEVEEEEELERLQELLYELEGEGLSEEEGEDSAMQDILEAYADEILEEDENFMEGYGVLKDGEEGQEEEGGKADLDQIKEEDEGALADEEAAAAAAAAEAEAAAAAEAEAEALAAAAEAEAAAAAEAEAEAAAAAEAEAEALAAAAEAEAEADALALAAEGALMVKGEEWEGVEGEGVVEEVGKELAGQLLLAQAGGHAPGSVCFLTWKIYCNWLTEFGDNIQSYGKCLRNFKVIFDGSEQRPIELVRTILMNWSKYFKDCRQFEEKLTKYFRDKPITNCPLCLEDYSLDALPADHEVPQDLIDVMRSTETWREMLNEAETACKAVQEKVAVEEPPSPDEVSLTSVGTIEITEVPGSAQSSDSYLVLEEVEYQPNEPEKKDDTGPCGFCKKP